MVLNFGTIGGSLFNVSENTGEGFNADTQQAVWNDAGEGAVGIIPIKGVIPWFKSLGPTTTLPYNFVECNGQVLTDPDSILNGQTMPDLNNTQRFIRGSSTSGTTGGADTHNHTGTTYGFISTGDTADGGGSHTSVGVGIHTHATHPDSSLPAYCEAVWIIRVK